MPIEIDDAGLRRRLARELAELADAGEARPPKELLERAPDSWAGATPPAPPTRALPADELYRAACRSVVAVGKLYDCTRCGGRHANVASGFVVDGSGLVVTARHVLNDADRTALGVMTLDGTVRAALSVVAVSRRDDLALLRVDGEGLEPLPPGDEPEVGAPVFVVGHPAGRLFTLSDGIVSRYSSHPWRRGAAGKRGSDEGPDSETESEAGGEPSDAERVRVMTITADFGRGSSGAPVLDARGAVVGVALRTRSIHFHGVEGEAPRLQTVLKHCAPASALRGLLAPG